MVRKTARDGNFVVFAHRADLIFEASDLPLIVTKSKAPKRIPLSQALAFAVLAFGFASGPGRFAIASAR